MDVYTNLFNDAEPEEYVARLGEQRIRESRVEHVRLGEEAQPEIFLRKQPTAGNQVLLHDVSHIAHTNIQINTPARGDTAPAAAESETR